MKTVFHALYRVELKPPRKLKFEGVMPEIKVVGNGWITMSSYQRKGYAYIVP